MTEIIKKPIKKAPNPPKTKLTDFFPINSFITIVARNGLMYSGIFKGFVIGHFYLEKVEIKGKTYQVETDWVLVERVMIQHIHPKNVKIELLPEPPKRKKRQQKNN